MFLPKLNRVVLGLVLAPLALTGCGSDLTGDGGEVSEGEGDSDGEAEAEAEGDGDGETETIEPEPTGDFPASGISITQVEANQGTAVFIGENGEWVPGEERLAPLVKQRNTLIRVHYAIDPSFTPREIQARLILGFPDGTSKTFTHTREVADDSKPNALSEIFYFGLAAEDGLVVPGMTYKVELHELDENAGAGEPEGVWQTPPEPEEVGIQPEPVELKIVFVPYHHLYEGIDRLADTSDANMQVITDALIQHNPIEELIWEVHEPEVWELPMDNLGSVLGRLAAIRDNELALPNVYYHALFPVPNGGVAGVAGVASVPGPGKGEGDGRVSVSALGNNVNGTAGVVVHEVGHNEGLQHVFCPFAAAANPDPTYPFENGQLGTWGFGIIDFQLRAPDNHYDYMSYCGPSWVSRWSWTKTFNRVRTLTAWDYEGPASGGLDLALGPAGYVERDMLMGSINADGEFWWTSHGTLPDGADPYGDDYDHYIELRGGAGELLDTLPAVVRYTNDYSTAWIIAELPREFAKLDGVDTLVRYDDHQQAHAVSRKHVQLSRR